MYLPESLTLLLAVLESLVLLLSLGNAILFFLSIFKIIKFNLNKKIKIILVVLSVCTLNMSSGIYFIKIKKTELGSLILGNLFMTAFLFYIILRIGMGLTMY